MIDLKEPMKDKYNVAIVGDKGVGKTIITENI